jgi:hypothetical protein
MTMAENLAIHWRLRKMVRFGAGGLVVGFLFICGCQVAPRSDPYVTAAEGYITRLEQWNPSEGLPPEPPQPAYVQCAGFDTHPPALGMDPALLGTPQGSIYLDYHSRSITNTYAYNCSRINSQRKKAYNAALKRYEVTKTATESSY